MLKTGRVALGRMEEVIFGKPAAEAAAQGGDRSRATGA
jgi:hypothetical protein